MSRLFPVFVVVGVAFSTTAVFGDTVVPGGTVSGIWAAAGSPYLIQGNITVHADSALIIAPGVVVNFQGHYSLVVDGALLAEGAIGDSVTFTAADAITGWQGIRINEGIDSARLEYCVIEHGHRTGSAFTDGGGGIYIGSVNTVVSHTRISDCSAYNGGGMSAYIAVGSGSLTISACTFSNNEAETNGGGFSYRGPYLIMTDCLFASNQGNNDGGGLYCFGWLVSSVDILGCAFFQNHAMGGGGGAMIDHVQNGSGVNIADCEFICNSAYNDNGGGLYLYGTEEDIITNCTFSKNFCFNEGLYCKGGGAIFNNSGNLNLSTCVFEHNWAACGGSALSVTGTVSNVTTIESCTFARNHDYGTNDPGAIKLDCNAAITNSIVSGTYTILAGNPPGINFISGAHSIEHCDFANNSGDYDFIGSGIPAGAGDLSGVNTNGDSCDVYGNIFLDPLLCDTACMTWDTADGDYRIADLSPCLGAGEGSSDIGALGVGCTITDVPVQPQAMPSEFSLSQNYPNPFNPSTVIEFNLKRCSHVSLSVFNSLGQGVVELIDEAYPAGNHKIVWDGRASNGRLASSGVYFYRLVAGDYINSKKMILLK